MSYVNSDGFVNPEYSYKCKFCNYGLYDANKGGFLCTYYDYNVDFCKCCDNIFNSNFIVFDIEKGVKRVYRSRFSKGLYYTNVLIKDLKTSDNVSDVYEIKRLLYASIDELVAGRIEQIKRKRNKKCQ